MAHGPNRLAPPRRRSALMRLLIQFHNVLLYVMMGSALVTAVLGHWVDTGVLLAAVVVNAVIGFIQEGKRAMPRPCWTRSARCSRRTPPWRGMASAARSMRPSWCRATWCC
ncbi:MAG: cation-transporting P-type ATPase [Aquabacterium sp.]|uniref:cation-transporting P-type ATPase n=1 Tax=Aquabacterium sp. TaxID=1872578 RepID=UPI003BAF45E6